MSNQIKFCQSFFVFIVLIIFTGNSRVHAQNEFILENGSYFNGKAFVPFREITIKDGKITAISNSVSKKNGQRIVLDGKYVIPGLIDAHEHISGSPTFPYVFADADDNLKSNLHCGVTTVIDLFFPEDGFKAVRETADASPETYATVLMSGPILTAPGGHGTEYGIPTRTMTSVEEAGKITNQVIDNGADVIKVAYQAYSNPHTISKDILRKIVEVAHKRNKKVFVHIDDAAEAVDCVDVGADVLAHMPVNGLTNAQLTKIKKSGIVIIPTITVLQSFMEGMDSNYMSHPLLWKTTNPAYLDHFARAPSPKLPDSNINRMFPERKYRENLTNCIKMNIPILAGTDAGNYAVFHGYSLHNELQQYVKAGMDNAAALRSATENISMVFPDLKTGKIKEGYDADIVVLGSDPLQNIANTKDIQMIFHKGRKVNTTATVFEQPKKYGDAIIALKYDATALDIEHMDTLPAFVTPYNDKMMGGSSETHLQLQKENGNNSLHVSGKVVLKGYVGMSGVGFFLGKKREQHSAPVDISQYKSISFDVKGNGETYYLMMPSTLVTDYSYHYSAFTTTNDWQTIKIPLADLKQNPYYGKKMDLDAKTIQAIVFLATGKEYNVDFQLKNIQLITQ